MRKLFFCSAAMFVGLLGPAAFAQTAGQDMKNAGSDIKDGAKDTGKGIKQGATTTGKKVKHGTHKAAQKVADKTQSTK